MDPSSPSEGPMEHRERRKIQFAVPATELTQLDPRQVEMIRRRRPTPATLFKVADQTSPEDDISTHQWVVGENGVLKPKRINPNIYQPPSLKAVQQMAEAHMQKLGVYRHVEEEGGAELSSSCIPDSQEQRGMAEHQPGMRNAGATAPTDEEEEEEVEADDMAEDECRNVD
ncbi:protein phosphatase 1 regulatory subunit 1B-like isoform X1 [Sinocyclocheilus anshuiensis]|uniref:protein phosphatase 1 regulatory subunit 1B-like isoform X1 n=1 Tax=Sinocyclocheilus anshuiensis TaxID=1608454 RepID=UPI0007BAAA51|nr:PREDICTED: protein phosphatase 1 regulatory subunit 1B-like isoform X1 [Sinocyclocheilus anshuiensis]